MKEKFKSNPQYLDIESNKKFRIYSDFKKKTISPTIAKKLQAGKKIGLPNGFVVDKKNKKIIRTQTDAGKVSATYRKAIMLRPNDIINNKQNEDIYNVGTNAFVKRNDVLISGKNYLKTS